MAFEADCVVSTVLEALCVARTAGYLTSRVLLVAQASRLHAMLWRTRSACMQPGRPHHKADRFPLLIVGQASRRLGGKFEIRNSKFEISHYRNGCKNLSHRGK
jgi:hypothetical protein